MLFSLDSSPRIHYDSFALLQHVLLLDRGGIPDPAGHTFVYLASHHVVGRLALPRVDRWGMAVVLAQSIRRDSYSSSSLLHRRLLAALLIAIGG